MELNIEATAKELCKMYGGTMSKKLVLNTPEKIAHYVCNWWSGRTTLNKSETYIAKIVDHFTTTNSIAVWVYTPWGTIHKSFTIHVHENDRYFITQFQWNQYHYRNRWYDKEQLNFTAKDLYSVLKWQQRILELSYTI